MTLTSDEVNFLIYRYMLESGFVHSAFAFGHESHVSKSKLGSGSEVPPGALISFIQKGLQFTEIEAHVNDDGTETVCHKPFSVLNTHECEIVSKSKLFDPDVPMEEDFGALEVNRENVQILRGHGDVVSVCQWNPVGSTIVSASEDSTARIWRIEHGSTSTPIVIKPSISEKKNAVICVSWTRDGSGFATASYDGQCQTWTSQGTRKFTLDGHSAPVSCVCWNNDATTLLSCSLDSTIIAWNALIGKLIQLYKFHQAPVMDLSWRNNDSFASCSTDTSVCIASVRSNQAIKSLRAHNSDVNSVRWNPTGTMLASCSDDKTVKVWNGTDDTPIFDFRGHGLEVGSLSWSSIKIDEIQVTLLASASWDCTIRVWDLRSGTCLQVLSKHLHPVTSMSFSLTGEYLASVSHDRLYIWSSTDGVLVQTYKAIGGINDVSWHISGKRLAIPCSNNSVAIVRFCP